MPSFESPLLDRWVTLSYGSPREALAGVMRDLANCPEADRADLVRRFSAFVCGPRARADLAQQLFSFIEATSALAEVTAFPTAELAVQQQRLHELRLRLQTASGERAAYLKMQETCLQMHDRINQSEEILKGHRHLLLQAEGVLQRREA
jgi:hypothetical protein